uniref:C-type lectin domain-containing protein n=1 Tax=Monopterus albus TaxID=43700 RepID=A0A3Q3JWK6_MONAL
MLNLIPKVICTAALQSQTTGREVGKTTMEKVFLSIIVASGLCGVSSRTERRYHFVYDLYNMTEALSYCREKHTDLATIDNQDDVNVLNALADPSKMNYSEYSSRAWIGLYDDLNSWRWSLSDTGFYKHGETEFRNWLDEEPNNMGSGRCCTRMYSHGPWNDDKCENRFMAVCANITGSNVTFILINVSMTWMEAQSYCRAHYTDLASVRNMAENIKVVELIPQGGKVWIGLFRDSWKWTDGSNSSFRFWHLDTREPNNNAGKEGCVAADFNHSGHWEDWNCNVRRAFICYSEIVPVVKRVGKVKLMTKSSSLNLNDPAVMEDILMQLQQRLKDSGVNEGIRLSWRKQSDGKVFHKDEKKTKRGDTIPKKQEL